MILKPLNAEATISANTTVESATCVRLYCSAGGVVTNETTGASFTMPTGSITFLKKDASDEISATGTILGVKVAFAIA